MTFKGVFSIIFEKKSCIFYKVLVFIFQNKYYLGEKHILYKFEFLDLVFGKKTKKVDQK